MLQPQTHHGTGVTWYRSPLLAEIGVPHGFTTRLGGVSPAPFDSLNFQPASRSVAHLGPGPAVVMRGHDESPAPPAAGVAVLRSSAPPIDQFEAVVKNFERVRTVLDCGDRRIICIWQVHGRAVCVWPDGARDATPDEVTSVVAQADALATADRRALLAVRVADCVPVLLADGSGRAVAAAHAGWRGVVDGVVLETLDTLRKRWNIAADDVIAAIGPCIGVEHFEVGVEVADAFDQAGLSSAVRRDFRPRPHIDLQQAIRLQLNAAGVADERIDGNDRCTFRDANEFFSHRRDAGRTGRMAAIIGVRVAT